MGVVLPHHLNLAHVARVARTNKSWQIWLGAAAEHKRRFIFFANPRMLMECEPETTRSRALCVALVGDQLRCAGLLQTRPSASRFSRATWQRVIISWPGFSAKPRCQHSLQRSLNLQQSQRFTSELIPLSFGGWKQHVMTHGPFNLIAPVSPVVIKED